MNESTRGDRLNVRVLLLEFGVVELLPVGALCVLLVCELLVCEAPVSFAVVVLGVLEPPLPGASVQYKLTSVRVPSTSVRDAVWVEKAAARKLDRASLNSTVAVDAQYDEEKTSSSWLLRNFPPWRRRQSWHLTKKLATLFSHGLAREQVNYTP